VGPNATLIFEIELVSVKPTEPKTAAQMSPLPKGQPVTSDIIKVPSADEIKKGAKIEILKPEDVEKLKQAEKK
jgi:hypothetical protein